MEILIAAGALAMSALFFVLAGRFPELAADPGGLALFPRTVALVTGAASAAFLVQTVLRRRAAPESAEKSRTPVAIWFLERRVEIMSFALVFLLPFAIQWVGFVAAIGIFTALILLVSRVRLLPLALTTVLTTAGVYVVYAIVLGAILPDGKLWN